MLYNQWTAYLTKCYYFTNCDNFFINTTIYTQYTLYIILELQYIIFSQCSDRSTIILLSLLWYISTLLFTITVTGHLKSIRFLFWNSCFTKDVALYFGIHRCFMLLFILEFIDVLLKMYLVNAFCPLLLFSAVTLSHVF